MTTFVEREVNCPVCDARNYTVLFEPWVIEKDPVKLYGAATGIQGTQRIVRCNECSMIYQNPMYSKEVILQGYMNTEESLHDSQYSLRVDNFYRALDSLKGALPQRGAKVLDIGTAGGAFLTAAERFGYEAYGLEPSQYLSEQGVKRGLKIRQGTIDKNPYQNEKFDLICMWDVIEHLVSPKHDLMEIRRFLKPGGRLLINYPDIGTCMARLFGKRFWWILSVHLHHFTRTTICKICERTGYEIVLFKAYWQILQFGYLQDMAVRYNIPFSTIFRRLTPDLIKKIPVPYYASQTTAIAKVTGNDQN